MVDSSQSGLGPYHVTVMRPSAQTGTYATQPVTYDLLSRRAVATLEEAREHITHECIARGYEDLPEHEAEPLDRQYMQVRQDNGGTVGPLPDGAVIEVKVWEDGPMRAWANFYGSSSVTSASSAAEIVDAFNARQS